MEVEADVEDAQPTQLLDQQPARLSHSTTASRHTYTGGGLKLSVKHIINDPKGMMRVQASKATKKLKYVLQTVGHAAYCLKYYYIQAVALDVEDQFL